MEVVVNAVYYWGKPQHGSSGQCDRKHRVVKASGTSLFKAYNCLVSCMARGRRTNATELLANRLPKRTLQAREFKNILCAYKA